MNEISYKYRYTWCLLAFAIVVYTTLSLGTRERPTNDFLRKRNLVQYYFDAIGHQDILSLAANKLIAFAPSERDAAIFKIFWKNSNFRDALALAAVQADEQMQYTGGFDVFNNVIKTNAYHFYDPDLNRNYWPFGGNIFPFVHMKRNAVEASSMYMDQSIKLGGKIGEKLSRNETPTDAEWADVGYQMGISLHYVTDLMQPMHAANFLQYIGDRVFIPLPWDRRHSEWESISDELIKEGYLDDTPDPDSYSDLSPSSYSTAEEILIELSKESNAIYYNHVVKTIPSLTPGGKGFVRDDIKGVLDLTVKHNGYKWAARFMGYFA